MGARRMPTFTDRMEVYDVVAERATQKALCVRVDGNEVWVPQSQIDDESEVYKEGDKGTLVVSRWIAEQKGWA